LGIVNTYEIFIGNLSSISKHVTSLGVNKNLVMGPETKNDCGSEGQQQITALLFKNLKKRNHSGDLVIDAIILEWILKKHGVRV
jgi:hypothetical protein